MNERKKWQGVTFIDLLTLIFITLRLCKVIDWSWVWVLAPEWVPLALQIFIKATERVLKGRENKWQSTDRD